MTPILEPEPNYLKNIAFWRDIAAACDTRIVILAPQPSYPTGEPYPGTSLRKWRSEEVDQLVSIHRFPTGRNRSGVADLERVVWMLSFLLAAVSPKVARAAGGSSVVYSYQGNLMTTIAAKLIALRLRSRLIVDVQDPWPGASSTYAGRGPVASCIDTTLRAVVWSITRKAIIVSPSDASGGLLERAIRIRNWGPNEATIPGTARNRGSLLYAGTLGPAQGVLGWVEAIERAHAGGLVGRLQLFGSGPEAEALASYGSVVDFHGQVDVNDLRGISQSFEFGLVPLKSGLLGQGFAPQKVAFYLSQGLRPLLAIADPTPEDLASIPPGCTLVDRSAQSWERAVARARDAEAPSDVYRRYYRRDTSINVLADLVRTLQASAGLGQPCAS